MVSVGFVVAMLAGQVVAKGPVPPSFSNPDKVCNALEAEQMPVQRAWQYGSGEIWFCESAPIEVGPPSKDGLVNEIQLLGRSNAQEVVKSLFLMASLMNPAAKKETLSRPGKLSGALFTTLALESPRDFQAAILKGQPKSWSMPFGEVRLEMTKGATASSLAVHVAVAGELP